MAKNSMVITIQKIAPAHNRPRFNIDVLLRLRSLCRTPDFTYNLCFWSLQRHNLHKFLPFCFELVPLEVILYILSTSIFFKNIFPSEDLVLPLAVCQVIDNCIYDGYCSNHDTPLFHTSHSQFWTQR